MLTLHNETLPHFSINRLFQDFKSTEFFCLNDSFEIVMGTYAFVN